MQRKYHFISGLPRSGSTLLCALLKQNPRFGAEMTSPVAALCGAVHQKMCGGEFGVFFDDEARARVLRGVFESYYEKSTASVIFDTNRSWTGRASLLAALFPGSKIICCVRDVGWIVDSMERMLNKNPLQLSRILDFKPGGSVYSRADLLMNSDKGLIGLAWSSLREAWFGDCSAQLIVVEYDRLVKDPRRSMSTLYQLLDEAPFEHDFDNVAYDQPDYDSHIGMPGLHKVRSRVAHVDRLPSIPYDLMAKFEGTSFWKKAELNVKKVVIV